MSVFNNIPAFNGLGKASLKLDFETETQLKDFARRYIVDEGDETPDNDPDPEKAAKAIINNLYRRTTGDAYMKPHKGGVDGPGDVYIITDTRSKAKKELDEIKALQKYDVKKLDKEALRDVENSDPLLFEQLKSDLNTPKAQEPAQEKNINDIVNSWVSRGYERVKNVVEEIEKNPSQIFIVPLSDNSLRYVRLFEKKGNIYRFEFVNENRTTKPQIYEYQLKDIKHWLKSPEKTETAPNVETTPAPETKQNNNVPNLSITEIVSIARDKVGREFELFDDIIGLESGEKWDLNFNIKAKKIRIFLAYNDWNDNAIKQNIPFWTDDMRPAIFWEKNAKSFELVKQLITKEPLKWFVSSYYPPLKDLIEYSFDFYAKYFDLVYWCDNTAEFYHSGFLAEISIENFSNLLESQIRELFDAAINDKVGNSERNYFIDIILLNDIKSYVLKGKKPVNKSFNNVTPDYFRITGTSFDFNNFWGAKIPKKEGLGQTASDALYNNLSILDTRGMSPTYQILPSYDQFFKPAEHKNSFAGFGLDDTKQLIADICRKHYQECAGIAAHLKGKTLLQSCFNLWHWLHHNIRYEYDRDGREEVRTPLRVWADRKRGVDCDCLSVFAWCVLKCMGYNPVFELVAFRNKKQLSHIFINCDGVVVDRVWFVFNQRPPQVTKREIYEVKLLQNLGQLF